jgi:hypothetical protein
MAKKRGPKRGPNGQFLPGSHKGSYWIGKRAYDSNGKRISREKALDNFKRSARKDPDLNRFLPSKLKQKRVKRRDYGGYKSGKYDLRTMIPGRKYVVFVDARVGVFPYEEKPGEETASIKTVTRTYTMGVFTREQLALYSREEFDELAEKRITQRLAVNRGEHLISILGYWRRPEPQLRRRV